MSATASADTIAGVRNGSAWSGDAKAQMAALDALVAREVALDDAALVPDGIRAYVARKHSGINDLEGISDDALDDSDEAAAERCRRLFNSWAKEAGIDRVRWIMKVDGNREDTVAAYAAHEADDLLRLMTLIRHKHRDDPEWDPGAPDEFAASMLLRQARDMSVEYRTRGVFGSSWKGYAGLSEAAQGKFEGAVMRIVAVSRARRSAKVEKFARKFEDRPIPTTQAEADQLMADMITEVIGRRVEPPTRDAADGPSVDMSSPGGDQRNGDAPDAATQSHQRQWQSATRIDDAAPPAAADTPDGDSDDDVGSTRTRAQGVAPADLEGRTYAEVIAIARSNSTGDFHQDAPRFTAIIAACAEHPQATEIRRELGRMLAAIAPDDVRERVHRVTNGYESGFEPGLSEARARISAGNFAAARTVLEGLVRRYGNGTGLFVDDSLTEYRHFANNFEAAIYVHLYPSIKHLRKLPVDRATLYALYGAVLIELRDLHGAEAAFGEALMVNPVSTYAMFELGEVMKLSGRKQEFRDLTLRALSVAYTGGALARAYRNLGYLAVEDADYDLAVACYCMSLVLDRERAQAAQSELFYIQQVSGKPLALPGPETVEACLATNGIQVGPSQLVTQLLDSAPSSEGDR